MAMINLFLVATIASALDTSGATIASTAPTLPHWSRLIEFNDPRSDRLAALGRLTF
jgi:hypothetical protein